MTSSLNKEGNSDVRVAQIIADLLCQHDIIRTQIKYLCEALDNLSAHQDRSISSIALSQQMGLFRWSLYDFQEGIQHHIRLDMLILEFLGGESHTDDIRQEHEEIGEQFDKVIMLIRKSVFSELSRKEMFECFSEISEGIYTICDSIKQHMDKEERLLKRFRRI